MHFPSHMYPRKIPQCRIKMYENTPKNMGYTDLTGRFPYQSSERNAYILVGYDYNGNINLVKVVLNGKPNVSP